MNFQTNIDSRYGPGTRLRIRKLEKLKIKLARETNHVTFLTKCKKEGLIPKGLDLKSPYHSHKAIKIVSIASKKLVQDRLNFHLKTKLELSKQVEIELSSLSNLLGPDFEQISKKVEKTAMWHSEKFKTTHVKKLGFLQFNKDSLSNNTARSRRVPGQVADPPPAPSGPAVINLSNKELDTSESLVLSKGLNFSVAPKKVNVLDFITGIESVVPQLTEEVADRFRCEASAALRNIKPPKQNFSKDEHTALKALKSDDTIKILPADKGNATVLLNKDDYESKISDVLKAGKYTLLKKDPTKTFESKIERTLRKHKQYFKDEHRSKLTPHYSKTPHMYGLPKIHKPNVPLRPIVSSKNSPSRELCRFLLPILKPLSGHSDTHVINSKHFVGLTEDMNVTDNDRLVSFDVESLFTNIPVNETLHIIEKRLNSDTELNKRTKLPVNVIMELLKLCTECNYFELQGKIYRQDEGMAMGSPLSPIFANIFMEEFEQKAIETSTLKPKVWLRYVDDTFVVWSHGDDKLNTFTQHLNNISPTIKLTVEKENYNTLPFLDVQVTRENCSLKTSVYRKKTHTGRYLNFNSNHSTSVKEGVAFSLFDRAKSVCQDKSMLDKEFKLIACDLKQNGYPDKLIKKCGKPRQHKQQLDITENTKKAFISIPYVPKVSEKIRRVARKYNIKTAFKTQNTLRQHLCKTKPKNEEQASKNCVYSIRCQCDREYIGETKRPLQVRLNEHKKNLKYEETTSSKLAKHAWEHEHSFDFNNVKILHHESHFYKRKFVEGTLIKLNSNPISQSSVEVRPLWIPMLKNHFQNKTEPKIDTTHRENTKQKTHTMTLRTRH